MMCKQIHIFVLLVFLSLIFPGTVHARNLGKDVVKGDILLVYDDVLSPQAHENVASISDILTYMGYSVCYRPIKNSSEVLKNFSHIVFYHDSNNIDTNFLKEFGKLECKILVVGSGEVKTLLKTLSLPITWTSVENITVNINYTFEGEKEISMLEKEAHVILLQGKFSYSNGTVEVGGLSTGYCVGEGRFSKVTIYDSSSGLIKAMFTNQIALWKWPYKDARHSYPHSIVFDNVYPFFDTQKMMETMDMMKEMGIPYAITVMPIYQNGEYPAMKRFCEVLRYAQANGGAIVLKAPEMDITKSTEKNINRYINIAFTCYSNYGVYPVALEAPNNWINVKLGQAVLRRFRTIILTPSGSNSSWTEGEKYNVIYADGHQLIPPALSDGDNYPSLTISHPSAMFLNMLSSLEDLRSQLQRIKESPLPLMNFWSSPQFVYTDNKVLRYKDSVMLFQGKVVSLEFTNSQYNGFYQYNRSIIGRMAESFKKENQNLLVAVGVIIIIFLLFIVIARYQNRKNFLY